MTVIGTTIIGHSNTAIKYYSPWMPRGGDAATFVAEAIQTHGVSGTFKVQIQTKNSEDGDSSASNVGTAFTVTLPTTNTAVTTESSEEGFKELVRYEFQLTGPDNCWIHFRMLNPIWQSN